MVPGANPVTAAQPQDRDEADPPTCYFLKLPVQEFAPLRGGKPGSAHVEITELRCREAALAVSGSRNPFTNVYPMASGCREPHGEDTAQHGLPKPSGGGVKPASDHKPIIGRSGFFFFFLTPFILQLKVLLIPRYEFSAFSVVKRTADTK